MSTFQENKIFADQFLDQQLAILDQNIHLLDFNKCKKSYKFSQPTPKDDMLHETDMNIYVYQRLKIALRVRAIESMRFHDISIRSKTPYGSRTEIHKIQDGEGDYYLYCWAPDKVNITEWILFDLDLFRQEMPNLFISEVPNQYGGAFCTFDLYKLRNSSCCVASQLITIEDEFSDFDMNAILS